jgi:hypothetical protein
MRAAISIAGLGMVSSLGYGAEANAAVMRCGYSKVLPTAVLFSKRFSWAA